MTRPIQFQTSAERTVELLPWTDADLTAMATVTPDDQRKAREYWRRHLPRALRDLLDAQTTVTRGNVHLVAG